MRQSPQSTDGRSSDEICPGQYWVYHFTVTEEMIGAWPFHDHSRHIGESINRGLIGGIIVLPKDCGHPHRMELPPMVADFLKRKSGDQTHAHHDDAATTMAMSATNGHDLGVGGGHGDHGGHIHGMEVDFELRALRDFLEEWSQLDYAHHRPDPAETLHVPLFFHLLSKVRGAAAFNKSPFSPGDPPFEVVFGTAGIFGYHCEIHTSMQGKVVVEAGGLPEAVVAIIDTDPMNMRFFPVEVHVQPGGKVRWTAGTVQRLCRIKQFPAEIVQ